MSKSKLKQNAIYYLNMLVDIFPDAKIELCFQEKNTWQLLVAVILSAQTTDKKVNEVTPGLFRAFPSILSFSKADPKDVEYYIKTLGFFRNKSNMSCIPRITSGCFVSFVIYFWINSG